MIRAHLLIPPEYTRKAIRADNDEREAIEASGLMTFLTAASYQTASLLLN
jgi:hypothetical protein